ncbi:MAG: tetratricopeptide repeat protein, partial [Bacteroidota bacterium]
LESDACAWRFRDAWEKAYTHLATVRDLDKAHFAQMAQETQEFLAPYLYNAGVKQYNKGNYAQAHRYFWKTRQIFPQDPKVWLASAFTLWKLDRYDDAREAWSVAREAQQPSRYITADDSAVRHEAHVYWQRFVQQLGPESLATLSPFPQPFSWSPPLTQVFQAKNGSEKDDLAVLRQQIQQFPEDVRARASYAAILWHDDQRPAARVAYQEILMYDPQHQMAHQCWANFYMEKAFDAYMQYQTRYDARRQKGMYIQPYTYLEKALPHLEALLDETNEKWPSYVTAIQNCLVAAKAKEAN